MHPRMPALRRLAVRPAWSLIFVMVACPAVLPGQEPPLIALPAADATLRQKQFSRINTVRELADGTVLVSDQLERSLYVVDFRSGTVRVIGTRGDGPREYQWPGFLYPLSGDSTLFTDGARSRALLLDGASIVERLKGAERLRPQLGGEPWGADRSGRLLGFEAFAWQPDGKPWSRLYADSLRILLSTGSVLGTEAEASEFDTIAEVGGQGRLGVKVVRTAPGSPGSRETNLLASEGHAWLFSDGWIAVAHPDPYRVDWRRPDGRWIRGGPLPFTEVKVTRREKCFAISWLSGEDGCRLDGYPDWPAHVPPFLMDRGAWLTPGGISLRPTPDGMLLVKRTPSADSPPGNRYDVVDRSGALRGVVSLSANQMIVGFGRSSLYVVQEDDMDLLTLSRHPWPTQLAGGQEGGGVPES